MKAKWRVYKLGIISFLGALLVSLLPTPSHAHWADLSVAEIVVGDTRTQITLTFPTGLITSADDNQDGRLSAAEIRSHETELETFLGDRVRLTDGDNNSNLTITPLETTTVTPIQVTANTHTTLQLAYTWSQPVQGLKMHYDLFVPGVSTAQCLVTVFQDGRSQNFVFTPQNREFSLVNNSVGQQVGSFVLLGIEHIVTGYDHVLFLISLLMLGGGLGYILKIVTAFTVSHSITLTLAVLNIVSLPGRWVESAIALTIVYVAAENFWRKDLKWRWLITFGFGLIHGLGFASILQEINVSQSNLFLSLASFNIGVEIGQIAIVSFAFLILRNLRKRPWELTFRRLVSAGIVILGLFWFIERAFFAI